MDIGMEQAPGGPPPIPSEERVGWGPWWTLLWAFCVISVWSLVQGAVAAVVAWMRVGGKVGEEGILEAELDKLSKDGDVVGVMTIVSALAGCLMIVGIIKVRGLTLERGLGLRLPKWWTWPVAVAVTWLGVLGMGVLLYPFQKDPGMEPYMLEMVAGTNFLPLFLVGVAIGAPFFEEFFFRGLLHDGLKRSFLGTWGTVLVTAALFSVIHGQYEDPTAFAALFGLGVLFSLGRELSGSLRVSIAMHSFNNLWATGMVWLALNPAVLPESMRGEFEKLAQPKEGVPVEAVEKLSQ